MRASGIRSAAVAMIPVALLAAACNSTSDSGAPKGFTSAAASQGPAAPSGDASASGGGGATPAPAKPAAKLTADQLKQALIGQANLPSGWSFKPEAMTAPQKLDADPAGCQAVVDLVSGDPKAAPTASANASLTGDSGTKYLEAVEEYSGTATSIMSKVLAEVAPGGGCTKITATAGTFSYVYEPKLSSNTPKGYGDAAAYLEFTVTAGDGSGHMRYQVVRVGDVLIQFGALSKDTPAWMPDSVVKAQVDRIRAAQK